MNTISTDFRFFMEHDINPFVLFSQGGVILYLNKSAELIMGIDTQGELFDLALTHAPKSFGSRTTLQELSVSSYEFYGINTLYSNDDEIGIHLYSRPRPKVAKDEKLEGYISTDINVLLQANIELFKIHYSGQLSLMTDYTMPPIKLHQNRFSMLLREVFAQFTKSNHIKVILTIKIGSKIVVNHKAYTIFNLKLQADGRDTSKDSVIKEMALSNYIDIGFKDKSINIEIPAIT